MSWCLFHIVCAVTRTATWTNGAAKIRDLCEITNKKICSFTLLNIDSLHYRRVTSTKRTRGYAANFNLLRKCTFSVRSCVWVCVWKRVKRSAALIRIYGRGDNFINKRKSFRISHIFFFFLIICRLPNCMVFCLLPCTAAFFMRSLTPRCRSAFAF